MSRAANSFDQIKSGEFKRTATDFHRTVEENSEFPPEAGRYVLFVSLGCPWAHRTLITRALKGLTHVIDVIYVNPVMGVVEEETGKTSWVFSDEVIDGIPVNDPLYNSPHMRAIYELHDPEYAGRYTVPVFFDTKTKQIVNNESSEIIQILDKKFNAFALYPEYTIRPSSIPVEKIEAANDRMYNSFNNGVYRSGFAQAQEAYDTAVREVFGYLDEIEEVLKTQRYVAGDEFSESDIRLWVSVSRFDPVYNQHFKCSLKKISEYPSIYGWQCDVFFNILAKYEGGAEGFNEFHVKNCYCKGMPLLNKFGIVPYTGLNVLSLKADAGEEKGRALAAERAAQFEEKKAEAKKSSWLC